MKQEASLLEKTAEPTNLDWQGLLVGDYDRAVIRLATAAEAGVTHLVFGWVELLPPEIPSPPPSGEKLTVGNCRLMMGRQTLPLEAGLSWYGGAGAGSITVPGTPHLVAAPPFGPEPAAQRFVVRDDVPFSPRWHGTPRVHRLVPMSDPVGPLADAMAGLLTVERWRRGRAWLEAQLHFDVLAWDDWVGGLALVAPNPVHRSVRAKIVARSDACETVEVAGAVRMNADAAGLIVNFQEERAGGSGWSSQAPMNRLGVATIEVPGSIDMSSHCVICPKRGLLHIEGPSGWIRSIVSQMFITEADRVVEVPPRSSGEAPRTYTAKVSSEASEVRTGETRQDGLSRLHSLRTRRERRSGPARPINAGRVADDWRLFERDRPAAEEFIRSRIASAGRRVVFVDPYFSASDLFTFAFATERTGVSVSILINPRQEHLRKEPVGAPDGVTSHGDWLFQQIARSNAEKARLRIGPVTVKVSASDRRFHDRFLIVDDTVWHCGHSFNAVGDGEISVMSRLRDADGLLERVLFELDAGRDFVDWWTEVQAARS